MSSRYTPEPSQIDYHSDRQQQRVARAMKLIDPGDVLARVDDMIAREADPKAHPLYGLVSWHLDRQQTPIHGGEFYDRWRQLILAAIDGCLDDVLEVLDEED